MDVDAKMEEILKKLDLSAHSVRFVEEKICPDIVWKLSIEDFHNLGINDRTLHVLDLVVILPDRLPH